MRILLCLVALLLSEVLGQTTTTVAPAVTLATLNCDTGCFAGILAGIGSFALLLIVMVGCSLFEGDLSAIEAEMDAKGKQQSPEPIH